MSRRTRNRRPRRRSDRHAPQRDSRRAVVLLIVLIVVAAISLAAYTFSDLMLTNHEAADLTGRQVQARYLVDSGIEAARLFLMQDAQTQFDSGGHHNNPIYFQARTVVADVDASFRGNFTVLAPAVDDLGFLNGVRYGLEDESNRLNLNALLAADSFAPNGGRELLMALPGMYEEIADAIMDWIDEDDDAREFGVESAYYTQLDPGYTCKNGPLDTVEELLLVRGVTPALLYGLDTNRNGMVDSFEQSQALTQSAPAVPPQAGTENEEVDASTGSLDRGWAGYLTLYSAEKNVNADGERRIFLNGSNLEQLHTDLTAVFSEDWATFIIAYRMASEDYTGQEPGELSNGRKLNLTGMPNRSVASVLDLIGKKVQVTFQDEQNPVILTSPFTEESIGMYINALVDNCTVQEGKVIPGRLNINQAPRALLLGVPGMTEEIVDRILEERTGALEDDTGIFKFETWLLTALIVTLDELKAMSPYICAGGDVYRAQIVGYYESGAAASRAEVVFDATGATPQLLFWRDISHLGRGYPLEILGVQAIDEMMPGTTGSAPLPNSTLPR